MTSLPEIMRGREGKPFREVSRLQRQIERLFDDFFSPVSYAEGVRGEMINIPSAEVEELPTQYVLTFDLPGLRKEDVKIEIANHQLHVSGERVEDKEKKKKGLYQSERFYGLFERSFSLPGNADADQVVADYKDGVLKITIPKSEKPAIQHIEIRAA